MNNNLAVSAPTDLRVTMLGAFEIQRGPDVVDIGPHKQRILLATLLSRANTVLSVEQLIDAVWEDNPPRTARKNLQAYVSMLRKMFGERLSHTPYGYVLRCAAAELDVLRFETLSTEGRHALRAGDPDAALSAFSAALSLWHGAFLADVTQTRFLGAEATRLGERRLGVYDEWAELCLQNGTARDVLDSIDEFTEAHPLHERLCEMKLLALYRCGRRTEALACYERFRRTLADELGLDPGPTLQATFRAILAGDDLRTASDVPPAPVGQAHNFPRDVGDFTGRDRETGVLINGLVAEEPSTNVALITGPVGSGKTALALRVARVAAAHFPDGQIFVPMRHLDGARRPLPDILTSIACSAAERKAADCGSSAAWHAQLARRRLLVVLDDAIDESTVRPLLPNAGRSAVLVTSRQRLSGIESVLRVPIDELTVTESIELVARVVGVPRVLSDRDSVMGALRYSGYSPLAVRIVAGRLDRVDGAVDGFDALTLGDLSVPRRYDDHYAQLTPAYRTAVRTLVATARPPYAHETISRVLGLAAPDVDRLIESLLEAHILTQPDDEVTVHSMGYQMSGLWYEYARRL